MKYVMKWCGNKELITRTNHTGNFNMIECPNCGAVDFAIQFEKYFCRRKDGTTIGVTTYLCEGCKHRFQVFDKTTFFWTYTIPIKIPMSVFTTSVTVKVLETISEPVRDTKN